MKDMSWPELADEARERWNRNAAFWDAYMGEGNDFHHLLVAPNTERLLGLQGGEMVLEIACGNGSFARRMADLGARVVALDMSEVFIERARARSQTYAGRIVYHVIDATVESALLALGTRTYDAAVCNMALMDMAEIDPLLRALGQLLKPGACFVFSVMHPCFNSVGVSKLAEEEDREGDLVQRHAIKVWRYITPTASKGLGIIGQPVPHYYFHRPLSVVLGACFRAGFVLDGLEEPVFPPSTSANRAFSWANYYEIPPVLVARLRLPPTPVLS